MNNKDMPAFPATHNSLKGLSKREYFAALAMQGLLSYHHPEKSINHESVAREATICADALLTELSKSENDLP